MILGTVQQQNMNNKWINIISYLEYAMNAKCRNNTIHYIEVIIVTRALKSIKKPTQVNKTLFLNTFSMKKFSNLTSR